MGLVIEGQPLGEALLTWGDPAAVAEIKQLEREGYAGPRMWIVEGPVTEDDRKGFRYDELREQLRAELVDKLRHGMLIASGYDSRGSIDAPPVTIPPDRWRIVSPDFDDSSAIAGSFTITGILVHEAGALAATAPATAAAKTKIQQAAVRLRIERGRELVFVDGSERPMPEQLFKLLCLFAERAIRDGGVVANADIEKHLWGDNIYKMSRDIRDVIRELRDAYAGDGGEDREALRQTIEVRARRGYRLQLAADEIALED